MLASIRTEVTRLKGESERMTKAEIISKTLREIRPMPPENEPPYSDEPDYEEIVIAGLRGRLPEGVDIKTCEDFKHLGVECCETCHKFYPHYEMKLIELPDGAPAWVCDAVEWAIYPKRLRALEEWGKSTPEGKLLRSIFGPQDD
jgi:hypothetical protein